MVMVLIQMFHRDDRVGNSDGDGDDVCDENATTFLPHSGLITVHCLPGHGVFMRVKLSGATGACNLH